MYKIIDYIDLYDIMKLIWGGTKLVKNINKSIVSFLALLLLLIIVPFSFASDNTTVVSGDEGNSISTVDDIEIQDNVVENEINSEVLSASNDIYFNASASVDGSGTQDNPYKYFYSNRLTSGCTAYFADGTYELDDKKGLYSSMSLIGQSTNNTIIKFDGIAFDVGSGYTLTLKNLTLNGATIMNFGTVDATNVIFENGVASSSDSYNNAYGGAIYNAVSSYTPINKLYNCTFMNNSAMYGGAIYLPSSGKLTISNSKFINNSAHWFGGAIAAQSATSISITSTTFEDCQSVDDAGGAIYAFSSDLDVENCVFNNCLANFAGAICSLNSNMTVTNTNFTNNLARYEGGAIYKMYGSSVISKSNFTGNAALNGGALFSDNCTKFEIKNSEFSANTASAYGGAIFSNANPNLTLDTVTFNDNKASYYENMLNQTKFSSIVSSSNNYSLFVYKSSFNGTLPTRYSLVDEGYVTPVQNQQYGGNCWAFGALASLESCILKASNKTFVFSAENMKNLWGIYSAYGWKAKTNDGGNDKMPIAYLTSWLGPVNATLDVYSDMSTLSPVLESEIHVQNIYVLPTRTSYTDNDAIKEAILKYGGLYTSYYHLDSYYNSNTCGYYYPYSYPANHAICVVGWDDNYPKYNFSSTPAGNGAFIVKNSWGSEWGDNGYFYISYYDKTLFGRGDDDLTFTFILNDTVRYTKNYQYDVAGMTDYLVTGKNTIWYQNIFNATGNEVIAAVSTYFNTTVDYEISVYVNDILKTTQSGTQENGGYYTIPLNEYVPVSIGDTFKVVVKLTNPKKGHAVVPISEQVSTTRCYYTPGVSYFSLDGTTWTDLYNYTYSGYSHTYNSQVACLKAFTISEMLNTTITLNNVTPKVQEITEIIANVIDSKGKLVKMGEVVFTIDGNNYTASVVNGVAKVNVTFNKAGKYVILATYQNNTSYNKSSTQITVNVVKNDVNLTVNINNIIYGENPIANINLTSITGVGLTDNVILRINNKNYTVNIINGLATFTVPEILNADEYQAIVDYLGSNKYNIANNFVNFTVAKKEINMNLTIDKDYRDVTVNVNLSEKLNGNLTLLVNNNPYVLNYINGTGSYIVRNLTYGNYTIIALFTKDNYESTNVSGNVEINPIKTILDIDDVIMYYHNGTRFIVNLKDINGNPLANMSVGILINGKEYIRTTDENGSASIALNLISGVYNVVTTFNETSKYFGCSLNNTVTILSTISGNDITKYFRNATQYYAFVSDFNGNPLANTTVLFNINGVFYNRTTNDTGYAKLSINLNPGEYIVTVINQLTGEQTSNKVTVLSKIVDNQDLVKYYKNGSKFHAKVLDSQGNPISGTVVTFNINGVLYYRETNDEGVASLAINLNPGNYTITTMYSQYEVSNNIEVLPTLKTQDLVMSYKDGSKFNATVLDGQGNVVANKNVTFNVNGVFYTRTTDDKGVASLAINLMSGEYIITSMYNGYQTGNKITIQ